MSMNSIRIGIGQMEIVHGNVEANRAKAVALTGEALNQGADIVLLPEGMNTGYCKGFKQ